MKNRSLLFLTFLSLSLGTGLVQAATLAGAEYYFDEDPGEGLGFPMVPADGVFDETEEEVIVAAVSTAGLSEGMHLLYVRVLDSEGRWSIPHFKSLVVAARPNILATAEYYFDEDPGEGLGFPMEAEDGIFDEPEEDMVATNVSTSGLSSGVHTIYVRVQDSQGQWSTPLSMTFQVRGELKSNTLAEAEYYFDEDPGEGLGFPMEAEDGMLDEPEEDLVATNVTTSGLSSGVHTVYVRVQDSEGTWSAPSSYTFQVKDKVVAVVAAEYYIDTDPGIGRAVPMQAVDGGLNEASEELIASSVSTERLGLGRHVVGVRVLDTEGEWSETALDTFEVIRPEGAVAMLDTMPHYFGNVLVGADTSWAVAVFNEGTSNLLVRSVRTEGEGFAVTPSSFTVSSGGSGRVTVIFAPQHRGELKGILRLQTNDPE